MDILDIIIAKKKSFTGETEKLTRQANEAMAKANEVAGIITSAQEALEAAEEANSAAEAAALALESMNDIITSAAQDAADAKTLATQANTTATQSNSIANNAQTTANSRVANVSTTDNNTSASKTKRIKVTKGSTDNYYDVTKNYTSTGQNEDGSMTQKAITDALASQKTELENKIKNSGGSGSGNISGNISAEDKGSIITVGEDGNIEPSTITEADIIQTQIITGLYHNEYILGLEIDYDNKAFSRLQGAINLSAGSDFDRFTMYGGRKRCVVDTSGNITEFITSSTNENNLVGQRIMVYQPAFYYMRVPISSTGAKVNKEHIYISEQKFAGFNLHPAFLDENGKALKFILLPAFESAAVRANGTLVTNDAQDINFDTDYIISTINIKPISGYTQELTISNARKLCTNNGTGWYMTNLAFESMNQMLAMIEYGTMNIQAALNRGIVDVSNTTTNNACITGSTYDLYNTSGRAESTINNYNGTNSTQTTNGRCAISYRGMENLYGGMWRFIDDISIVDGHLENTEYYLVTSSGWINKFAYYKDMDWAYLPIEVGGTANSNLPVGDYAMGSNTSYMLVGGSYAAGENAGLFYYHYNNNSASTHFYNDSARIMFKPIANSSIENNNYNNWQNS